ncbi:AAA family ATPase [Flavisphingomonas formosensis]|uniref:AAA family ATPase n=1 Tax=Flavisphingomonas formosensis TaxID=861534 RepID=UPI0012FB7ED3|nr:AAA family ATPase [Sphingomonas formosensis]
MNYPDNLHIVTGGPGSGKSSLVAALGREGLPHMAEAGRAIIRDQVAIGGDALPWANTLAFAEQMLGWEMRSYHMAGAIDGPVLFDRGVPDVLGYLRLIGAAVPRHVEVAAHRFRYARRVFIAPWWPQIYTHDDERKQSPEEAEATFRMIAHVYAELGYMLVPLPLAPVEERVRFVRQMIDA